jgi:hypothetical protein
MLPSENVVVRVTPKDVNIVVAIVTVVRGSSVKTLRSQHISLRTV